MIGQIHRRKYLLRTQCLGQEFLDDNLQKLGKYQHMLTQFFLLLRNPVLPNIKDALTSLRNLKKHLEKLLPHEKKWTCGGF